jgi:uncharacterized membrane protein
VSGTTPKRSRVEGIDVARGLASAIMIQGHAYDGWVRAEDKTSASYLFTRVLGTLPLPSFLLLAGAAIALRIEAADARGEPAAAVRAGLVKRGAFVLAVGYALNALSALLDGWEGPETFLRADVLQVIGLSIAFIGGVGVGERDGRIDRRRLVGTCAALAIVPIAICPPVSAALWSTPAPWSWAVGLVSYVPSVSRMPFVPLAAWAGMGVLLSLGLAHVNRGVRAVGGAPDRVIALLFGAAVAIAVAGTWAEGALATALGGTFDQRHWAVVPNALELAGRAGIVLSVGMFLAGRLPDAVRRVLVRLGRGSLVAYAFHVPFCYGALGAPIEGRLDMVEATGFVLLLEVASFGAVYVRDRVMAMRGAAEA